MDHHGDIKVCFIGGARYEQPLDATSEKKFRALKSLGTLFVIGFSQDLCTRTFTEHAHFYLLPQLPLPILRYVEIFVLGQLLILWSIVRYRTQVVIAQSPYEGFVAALAIKFAAWFGYKVGLAVEVHGDFEESLFLYRRIRFRALHRFLMKQAALYSLEQADVLRAVSSSTTNQLKRWAPKTRIVQFPTWTDIETFLEAGRIKTDNTCSIVYAGVLSPVKGIHHLINAFSFVAEQFLRSQLFIIGKEENAGYATDLREQVRKLGLEDRIRFMGTRPQSNLAVLMGNATVLVLPSLSEGLPRVIIEAMATGTPVIGSRVGGISELVEDGTRGFLVPPGDESLLAEKLRWLLDNPNKARAMGECARTFAEQLFSTARYVEGYREILQMSMSAFKPRSNATSTL
jgi:glycosyltransferase involved in cell wall biosynthesis